MTQTFKNNIKLIIISIVLAVGASLATAAQSFAQTETTDISNNTKCGSNISGLESGAGAGCDQDVSGSGSDIEDLIKTVINVFSVIVGAVSVVMIIFGGFRYITSGGDSNGVSAAKNTILYAIVGLVIVAFAQIIVQFVLQRAVAP